MFRIRHAFILLLSLFLAACGAKAPSQSTSAFVPGPAGEVTVTETVTAEGPFGAITLGVPDGWYATVIDSTHRYGTGFYYPYGIRLETTPEFSGFASIDIACNPNFGIPDSSMEQSEITVADTPATLYSDHGTPCYILFHDRMEGVFANLTSNLDPTYLYQVLDSLSFDPERQHGFYTSYDPECELPELGVLVVFIDGGYTEASLELIARNLPEGLEATFDGEYGIERLENDAWAEVPRLETEGGDGAVDNDVQISELNDHPMIEVDWSSTYGELPAGDYRFRAVISVRDAAGKTERHNAYVHFILR